MNDSLLEQLRKLHSPEANYSDLECDGCDWGGYEGEAPTWPCRTAALVYTVEEIADIERDFHWWERWGRARRYRDQMATQPSWTCSLLDSAAVWAMNDRYLSDLVFPKIPFETNPQQLRREPTYVKFYVDPSQGAPK